MIRHLILDRDGTLNREHPDVVVGSIDAWAWEQDVLPALRALHGLGLRLSVATNQSCIGRGLLSRAALDGLHRAVQLEAEREAGAAIAAFFVCPHAPADACACRKPAPGLVQDAVLAAAIPAEETLLIGDDVRDVRAGRAAGVAVALVGTGKGQESARDPAAAGVTVYPTLLDLAATLRIERAFDAHARVIALARENLGGELQRVARLSAAALGAGGKILLCGNGGSAADCQHFASELTGRFVADRRPLAALALTTDASALTSIGNDYGYAQVFSRQVQALGRPGDVLFAISTSGNSENVLAAARAARDMRLTVVALTGQGPSALEGLADVVLRVPSRDVARVQEAHGLALHMLVECIESYL